MWEQGGSISALARFNLAVYVGGALAFLALGRQVKQGRSVRAFRLGLVIQAAFYLAILWLGPLAGRWLEPLGLVSGLGIGAYWAGQNLLIQHATPPQETARFWGYQGAIGAGVSLVAPLLGGWLLEWLGSAQGYHVLFSVAVATFLAAGFFGGGLTEHTSALPYDLRAGLADDPDRIWSRVVGANLVSGFRDGILTFLPAVLVYALTGSGLVLGSFVVITSAVGLVANWVTGRFIARRRPFRALLAGGLLQAAGALILLARMDYTTLLIYSLVAALFGPLQGVPFMSITFTVIGAGERDLRMERIVVREMALVAGRALGMALLLVAGRYASPELTAAIALAAVAGAAVPPALLLRRAADLAGRG